VKTYIKISIILFIAAFFLFGCGSGQNTVSIESEKRIEMKNYSVNSPVGDDWEFETNKTKQVIMFHKQRGELFQLLSSKNRRDTYINIFRNGLTNKAEVVNRRDFANNFMDNEFRIMQKSYEETDYGEPELLEKDSTTINGKVLYRMKYGLSCSLLPGSGYDCFNGEGQLYIYLPKTFENNAVFYVIIIEEYGQSMFYPYDFDLINGVITSFSCDED